MQTPKIIHINEFRLKKDLKLSIFSSPNAKFSLTRRIANSKNIKAYFKKGPEINLFFFFFFFFALQNFLRQSDVQPPPKIIMYTYTFKLK